MKDHQRTHKQVELDTVKYMDELIKVGPSKQAKRDFKRLSYYQICKAREVARKNQED